VCSSISSIAPWEIEEPKKPHNRLMFMNKQNAKTRPWIISDDLKDTEAVLKDMVAKGLKGREIMENLTKLYPPKPINGSPRMQRKGKHIRRDNWPNGTIKETHPNGFALMQRASGREDVITPEGIEVEVRMLEVAPPAPAGPAAGMSMKQIMTSNKGRKPMHAISKEQLPVGERAGISAAHQLERITATGKKVFESPVAHTSQLHGVSYGTAAVAGKSVSDETTQAVRQRPSVQRKGVWSESNKVVENNKKHRYHIKHDHTLNQARDHLGQGMTASNQAYAQHEYHIKHEDGALLDHFSAQGGVLAPSTDAYAQQAYHTKHLAAERDNLTNSAGGIMGRSEGVVRHKYHLQRQEKYGNLAQNAGGIQANAEASVKEKFHAPQGAVYSSNGISGGLKDVDHLGPVQAGLTEMAISTPSQQQQQQQVSSGPPPFVPSNDFAGIKAGYWFGMGNQGLGYYSESNAKSPAPPVTMRSPQRRAYGISTGAASGMLSPADMHLANKAEVVARRNRHRQGQITSLA